MKVVLWKTGVSICENDSSNNKIVNLLLKNRRTCQIYQGRRNPGLSIAIGWGATMLSSSSP
jgi:hypothetical protein